MFRLRLSTAYISTAKIYNMVFYCLFQDNIWEFNMCFPIRCLGFYSCLCISCALFWVMIFLKSLHTLMFSRTLFRICLAGFQCQTCTHLCFLHCVPYGSLAHMDSRLSINKVLPPTWLRRIKNRNSDQSLLQLLATRALQPPSYLPSIIHIE